MERRALSVDQVAIELDRAFYTPGETIKGVLHLHLERAVKVRSLEVSLQGREKVTIDPPAYIATAHKTRYSSTNELFDVGLRLLENASLQAGDQALPFEFSLPPNALPSFIGAYTAVSWKLTARADLPWKFDLVDEVYLRVLTVVVMKPTPAIVESKEVKPQVRIELPSNIYAPGERIEGTVSILDASKMRAIRIQLMQSENALARGGWTDVRRHQERPIGVIGVINRSDIEAGTSSPFRLAMPSTAPTTYQGVYSSLSWSVDLVVDIPMSADIHLNLPISVALRRAETEGKQSTELKRTEAATIPPEEQPNALQTPRGTLTPSPAPDQSARFEPSSSTRTEPLDVNTLILDNLKDGSWKDLLTISSEIQLQSSGFIDLNQVKKACDRLVSEGRLQRRGEGEFFSQYSLVATRSERFEA